MRDDAMPMILPINQAPQVTVQAAVPKRNRTELPRAAAHASPRRCDRSCVLFLLEESVVFETLHAFAIRFASVEVDTTRRAGVESSSLRKKAFCGLLPASLCKPPELCCAWAQISHQYCTRHSRGRAAAVLSPQHLICGAFPDLLKRRF